MSSPILLPKKISRLLPLLPLLILQLWTVPALSQTPTYDQKQAHKLLKKGDEALNDGIVPLYQTALTKYLAAVALDPGNAKAQYFTGLCYLNQADKFMALPYLERAYLLDPNVSKEINYLLGYAYQRSYEFDKALACYQRYLKQLTPNDTLYLVPKTTASLMTGERFYLNTQEVGIKALPKQVQKRITECESGLALLANPVNAQIENIGNGPNSAYSDFGPVISADESVLYFTSRRTETTGGGKDPVDEKYFEDIYVSYKRNGKWTTPKNIGQPFNLENRHSSILSLSSDGKTMFLYADDNEEEVDGNIYQCSLEDGHWSKPEPMEEVNSQYPERSITLSDDEKLLIFTSNRLKGEGGRDIYWMKKGKDGKWGKAENIGTTINTEWDEDGVFFHSKSNTLYFSSRGHNAMGGFDVFKSEWKDGQWSTPVNMGYPINTPDDDIYFVLSRNEKTAYFTSYKKNGFGEKDIYKVDLTDCVIPPLPPPPVEVDIPATPGITILKGTVFEKETMRTLEATIQLTELGATEFNTRLMTDDADGKYRTKVTSGRKVKMVVKAKGYFPVIEEVDIPFSTKDQEVTKDVVLDRLITGKKFILEDIYFDYDRSSLRPASIDQLENLYQILTDESAIKVSINGHTDSHGADAYNKRLSANRAREVVKYLINRGIDPSRLIARGYGEEQPIAPNELVDGSDNPEGRQMNRRVELEVIE